MDGSFTKKLVKDPSLKMRIKVLTKQKRIKSFSVAGARFGLAERQSERGAEAGPEGAANICKRRQCK